MRTDTARSAGLVLVVALAATAAPAREPLSAIDWLSDSVSAPPAAVAPEKNGVTDNAAPENVTVTPLGGPSLDAVGLLPPSVTGLPADLWGGTPAAGLARLVRQEQIDALPAMQSLLYTLLLAELDPPENGAGDGKLLLARLDKLLELGALDQAQALLERAGPTDPALFRRWFDVSLLTGQEDRACAAMRAQPDIAPTFPARIFCLARGGDWNAAALTLETGTALGYLDDSEDALLAAFLEPDLVDPDNPLTAPPRPSPLTFRMMEAIGNPLPTASLPRAFAHADLRGTSGWKAEIEAAERLAQTGAIASNRLLGIYTERQPAASGGVWDRVGAVQALDLALLSGNAQTVARTLPPAWSAMQAADLQMPFAELYGARLARLPLTGEAQALAFRVGLLSDGYESIADAHEPKDSADAFLKGLAKGNVTGLEAPGPAAQAIAAAFGDHQLSAVMEARLRDGRLGEALLEAMDLVNTGAHGDMADVTEGLALLRHVGLEETARRAALQLMILEPRA